MTRKAREVSETNIYHVVVRGADRQLIFIEEKDYLKYLDFLAYYKETCGFELYAYIIMNNHIHLMICVHDVPLSTIFQKLNTRYAMWFNKKYQRTGFVQQGRYFSDPILNDMQFMFCVCYIHHNAVKAGLEKNCGKRYRWSSFREYKKQSWELVDGQYVEMIFGGPDAFQNAHDTYDEKQGRCLDIDNIRISLPDDVAMDIITEISNCKNPKEFQDLSMLEQRKYIAEARARRVSIRQLNRLTGIPKGVIERIKPA